jgi:hypothetical protein
MGAEYEMALAQKDSTNQTLGCFRGSDSPKGCGNVRYVQTVVGDGATILFWTDKWIQGKSIADLVPELVAVVPRRFLKQRTMHEALSSGVWVNDIKRDLSDHAVFQCLCIWVLVQQVQLAPLINISGRPPH